MTQESDEPIGRRALLRLGSTALAGAVAGCQWGAWEPGTRTRSAAAATDPETPTETVTDDGRDSAETDSETGSAVESTRDRSYVPYSDEYGTVVDVVEDAGADPNAEESIVPVLEEHAGDDTLLYFPRGRYLMDGIWLYPEFTDLAIVGYGATIVPARGFTDYLFVLGLPGHGARGLVFEGFDFDFRGRETLPRPVQVQIADDFVVQNVSATGTSGTARFDVTQPDGKGVVKRLQLPDGGMEPNPVGCLVGPEHEGTLTFENCHVSGYPGNGLYASPAVGRVDVIGGLYENCGIANVRVSGPSTVRDVTVRCDDAPAGFRNMRGIRLRHGRSLLVEECAVEMTEVTYSEGAIVLEPLVESATIRNNQVVASADGVPAVNAKSGRKAEGDGAFACENLRVTGSAGGEDAVRIVDRNGCRLEGLRIEQTGTDRDGIHLIRSRNGVLRDAVVDVTGDPIVLEEATLERENLEIAGTAAE